MDRDRVLRPLEEARPSIDRLTTYESPAALQEALRATWHAVDRTLRTLLRSDPEVPDEVRLAALAPTEMTFDAVVVELRRRERITLTLAGRLHELRQAAARAEEEVVRASDADTALAVVELVRAEVAAAVSGPTRPVTRASVAPVPSPAGGGADEWELAEADGSVHAAPRGRIPPVLRRPIVLVAAGAVLLASIIVLVLLFGRTSEMELGVTAFRAGRAGVAEQHFRAALQQDRDNVTARLYLGRILREQQRYEEAANLLREAARLAPRDAAVRRELGYLFLVLNRPEQAATQFQQSVELDPDEPLGWVFLVQALRRADDPAAELWLSRAPATAQAMIRSGR